MADWKIDKSGSSIRWRSTKMFVIPVPGAFTRFEGTASIEGEGPPSSVRVVIEAASIDSSQGILSMFGMRDMMLRSPFFLSAGSFPEIVFEGSGAGDDGSTFSIDGTLTAKSTSAPVTLSVELVEATANARTYKATATADRYAHGAHLPKIMEGFGTMLSPQLDIEITVKLVGA